MTRPKTRVAVLGGGVGAMTAAFELTSTPALRERYEVTVYQLGWRLGGKGASGRNAARSDSIEEHGLHMWMGFYENAFRTYRDLFAAWTRPPDHPWTSWHDAFAPQSVITLMDQIDGAWTPWTVTFPEALGEPGDPGVMPSVADLLVLLVRWLEELGVRAHAAQAADPLDVAATHLLEVVELGWAVARGLGSAGITTLADFDKLDGVELRTWLADNGAGQTALQGGLLRSFYDLAFCYAGGDAARPTVAAGCGLRTLLRMSVGYKGAVLWKMRAGMGDTIFTPFYDVLRERGVKFEFFQRVRGLELTPDRAMIARVRIGVQATLLTGEYQPFVTVKGLRCWPSEPAYDQLVQGEQIEAQGVNLESHWAEWPDVEERVLELGREFDLVILGISLGALRGLCPELIAASPAWREMVDGIPTVQTQAAQLWLAKSTAGLGWTGPTTVLTSYAAPLSSWADMTELIPAEDWPPTQTPQSLAYLCGAMPGPAEPPPIAARDYPATELAKTTAATLAWLTTDALRVWPAAAAPGGGFDWDLLVGDSPATGPARLATQYVRANVDPSERYVQSPPGSTSKRLAAGGSGFVNLFLAGDWVYTGINGGSVEAAVMGGKSCSQAICGVPTEIPGNVTKP